MPEDPSLHVRQQPQYLVAGLRMARTASCGLAPSEVADRVGSAKSRPTNGFAGGRVGARHVESIEPVTGPGLPVLSRLPVLDGPRVGLRATGGPHPPIPMTRRVTTRPLPEMPTCWWIRI